MINLKDTLNTNTNNNTNTNIKKYSIIWPNTLNGLPTNYNFEIPKTMKLLGKIQREKKVNNNINSNTNNNNVIFINMQFPDGLLSYAPILINYITTHYNANVTILNDVVYGACCVDDSVPCDILIHYGHSCLISVSDMSLRVLYIFVDIIIDVEHIIKMIRKIHSDSNMLNNDNILNNKISLIGTIQFNNTINLIHNKLSDIIVVPQAKPLSRGEVLGCTSPTIATDVCVYIGDGRFHMEAAMIKNRNVIFYKYCPYKKVMSREYYDNDRMVENRIKDINILYNTNNSNILYNTTFNIGIILSGLGKQGNKKLINRIYNKIYNYYNNNTNNKNVKIYKIIINEINEHTLDTFPYIDAFVQVGCPRLSIDWGSTYKKPLLNAYEVLGNIEDIVKKYEMDYYDIERKSEWGMYK